MKVENPVSGWPPTQPLKEGVGFRVTAKHLTPLRAQWFDFLGVIVLFGLFVLYWWGAAVEAYSEGGALEGYGEFLLGLWVVTLFTGGAMRRRLAQWLFGKTKVIEFAPDVLRIKGFRGFKNYDRMLPHEFTYDIHEKAEEEEIADAIARHEAQIEGKKKLPQKERYYRDSYHIVLRYAGQRVDVATVTGKKWAEALLVRLQLLDQMMDAARGEIGGKAMAEPATQYGERPDAG